jgi:hypothetical protein
VTPKDLVGARIQNIEDSPHRKGSAYIAAYRFLREHDLQPYLYMTSDYGRTWTKLTDGRNGIPIDHPVRVVREDPERAGLLYAGTEFGFFVSFNNGKNWQALQQNLPATPVTDIRVHRGDLVIATMGRSFWIMDDITPLRRIGSRDMTMTSTGGNIPAAEILAPRTQTRFRYSSVGGIAGAAPGDFTVPQYPPVALAIDYYLPATAPSDLKLEIVDASGRVVRAVQPAGTQGAKPAPSMRGPRRGAAGASVLTTKSGHNRFLWDYRWATEGGMPPMAAPGKYTATLTGGGADKVVAFDVEVDPRVLKDNVTVADLVEQQNFLLKVNATIADARRLSARMEQTLTKAGLKPPSAPGPGEDIGTVKYQHPAQSIWARIVDAAPPYPKPVLINQLQNIVRMLNQADQKVGKDAYERFADLEKELAALKAEADRVAGAVTNPQP